MSNMFCYQCQRKPLAVQAAKSSVFVEKALKWQIFKILLIYTLKGVSQAVVLSGAEASTLTKVNHEVINSLFYDHHQCEL